MRFSTIKNRAIALILTILSLASIITIPAHAESIADGSTTVTIAMGSRYTYLENTDGVALGGEAWTYTTNDGITGAAYCIDYGLKAVPTTKQLPITGIFTSNPKTIGAFSGCYPQRSLADFLEINLADNPELAGLTEAEFAYGSQIAIWASMGQIAVEGTAFLAGRSTLVKPSSDAQKIRTFRAIEIILSHAANWTKPLKTGMTIRTEKDAPGNVVDIQYEQGIKEAERLGTYGIRKETINGTEYYTRVFYASSMTSTWKNGYFIDVYATGAPSGTIITDENNVIMATTTINGNTAYKVPVEVRDTPINDNGAEYYGAFKLCMPVSMTPDNGDVTLHSSSIITQYNVYQALNTDHTEQSYVIADPLYAPMTASGTLRWITKDAIRGRLLVEKVDGSGKPLAGASFKLEGGGKTYNGTSDANGEIIFEELDPNVQFTLTETSAPVGFRIANPENVTVIAGQTVTKTVSNYSESNFYVKKIDAQNGYPLANAVFKFEQIDGNYVTTGTTGSDGCITFVGGALPYGSYRVFEEQSPYGYIKDTSVQTVNWTGHNDITLTFSNVRKQSIMLIKKDLHTNESIEGATFRVYKDGTFVTTVTTNRAGEAKVIDVTPGYWEFEEVTVPSDWILDTTRHGIQVTAYDAATSNDPVLVVTNQAKPSLKITKYDSATGKTMPGVTFEVYRDTTLIGMFTTTVSGDVILKGLTPGTYLVKEVATDSSHVVNSTPQQIEIKAGDQMAQFVFFNELKPGIRLIKVDASDMKPLAGAVFVVSKVGGSFQQEFTTTANGEIDLSSLEPGAYTIREKSSAPSYVVDDNLRIVQINPGENATFVFTNSKKPELIVWKYDEQTARPLPNAEFSISYKGGEVIYEGVTGSNGNIKLDNLREGWITITELAPPPSYLLANPASRDVYVVPGRVTEVKFDNLKCPTLTIQKIDSVTRSPISRVTFNIKFAPAVNFTGGVVDLGNFVTDGTGRIVLDNDLPSGWYRCTEVSTLPDYTLKDPIVQDIFLKGGDNKTLVFENMPKPSLKILKYEQQSGKPLSGVSFEIYKDATLVGTFVTSDNGEILLNSIEPGTYLAKEVSTDGTHVINSTPQQIEIKAGDGARQLVFFNQLKPGIRIVKVDGADMKPLAGAVFVVSKVGGSFKQEFTTPANGEIILPFLEPGAYEIFEKQASSTYLTDSRVRTVQVNPDENATFVFTNTRKPSLRILKYDQQSGQPIPGVTYEVYRDSALYGIYTTSSNGDILLEYVEPGTYLAKEKSTDYTHVLNNTPQQIEIKAGDGVVQLVFFNQLKPGIRIVKVDSDDMTPLAGAVFVVSQVSGTYHNEFTTPENGEIDLSFLEPGTYQIFEKYSPSTHLIDDRIRTVKIEPDGNAVFVFTNTVRPSLVVWKYDEQTAKPLPNTEFSISYKGGEVIYEGMTNDEGFIRLDNLDATWVTVTELAPPPSYLLSTVTSRDVQLVPGKVTEIKFDNLKCPTLTVNKIDKANGEPIKGVRFNVKFSPAENFTGGVVDLGTFTTDANGQFVLDNDLQSGFFRVTELQQAPGYIMQEPLVQDIFLAGGDNKTLIFENVKCPTLTINKVDKNTQAPLAGVKFNVKYSPSSNFTGGVIDLGTFITDKNGKIILNDNLQEGWFRVTELATIPGWIMQEPLVQDISLKAGENKTLIFENIKCPTLTILKLDSVTKDPIPNTKFQVFFSPAENFSGSVVDLGIFYTDEAGRILLDNNLESGWYRAVELECAPGYTMKEPQAQNIFLRPGDDKTLTYENIPKSALIIRKTDSATGLPVQGATFEVKYLAGNSGSGGTLIKTGVTSVNGTIVITGLQAGTYVCEETIPAPGYQLSNPSVKTAFISGLEQNIVELVFNNPKMGHLVISKMDSVSRLPLAGVTFLVTDSSGAVIGANNGEFTTDESGIIEITEYLPIGSTINVKEIRVPDTHNMDAQPQSVKIMENTTHRLNFYNSPKSGIQIVKIDADSKEPLKGAQFSVYKKSGDLIGEYETNSEGIIFIEKLSPQWVKIVETRAPEGFLIDDTPKDVEITNNQFVKVVFENKKIGSLQIKKISEFDGSPLAGATFVVTKQNGELVGEYTTGKDGLISIVAEPSWYVVSEKKAPNGFILDETPKTVEVKAAAPTVATFTNKPFSGLQIIKTDSATRQPIQNVEFAVAKINGERIGTYKTDRYGMIYLTLEPGHYTVTETRADGYIVDGTPRNIEIKWGNPVVLEIENTPMSGIVIVKTDANTRRPLEGVKFELLKTNGERVGLYTTDSRGRVYINDLTPEKYVIYEREALPGYALDTRAYEVNVRAGRQETVEITNKPLGGLRLVKIDSVTKKGIYNVEFMVFDSSNKVVGTFYTDNNGVIDFVGILTEGRYTIRETRPAANYYNDDVPRTVQFKAGEITEIRWENTPKMGQIQILKKSGDDNQVNGLPAGTPLAGAVFEVYDYKSGNLVDRFVSQSDGRAVSKPLPLGRYLVKEVQSPQWFKLSTETLDIEIEFATQIVKKEFVNYSANTGVTIKKTAPAECMPGDTIRYDIKTVQNNSTVPLTDFYWRDTLPTDAVRLGKIVTGTYNQALRYKIMITTNKGDTRVIADNLSTTQNNVIDCSNAALGLRNDEFVTSFTLVFGTVKAGFSHVVQPQIFVNVLSTLPNGYQFSNKVDIGGKYGNEWVVGNSTANTKVYRKPEPLPRTGS